MTSTILRSAALVMLSLAFVAVLLVPAGTPDAHNLTCLEQRQVCMDTTGEHLDQKVTCCEAYTTCLSRVDGREDLPPDASCGTWYGTCRGSYGKVPVCDECLKLCIRFDEKHS